MKAFSTTGPHGQGGTSRPAGRVERQVERSDRLEGHGAARWAEMDASRPAYPEGAQGPATPPGWKAGVPGTTAAALRDDRGPAGGDGGGEGGGGGGGGGGVTTLAQRPNVCYITENLIRRRANCPRGNLRDIAALDLHLQGRRAGKIRFIEHLDALTGLAELNLSYNIIAQIENLDRLVHLRDLNLAENNIRRIENLEGLSRLERLNLSGNKIARLPRSLRTLRRLAVLRVARNELVCLEDVDHLSTLKALSNFSCHDNPMMETGHPNAGGNARDYVVFALRSLDVLDGESVGPLDRGDADRRFAASKAKTLADALAQEEERVTKLERGIRCVCSCEGWWWGGQGGDGSVGFGSCVGSGANGLERTRTRTREREEREREREGTKECGGIRRRGECREGVWQRNKSQVRPLSSSPP